jgi:hypothetical protein
LLEGCGDGEIIAYVDDTTGEGDILSVVLSGASEHLSGEVLELDRFRDAMGFVEAIHIESGGKERRVIRGLYRALKMVIIEARNRGSSTHKDIYL